MQPLCRTCKDCGATKPLDGFRRRSGYKFGRDTRCRECARKIQNPRQRALRKRTRNVYTKRYEKTPRGFLMRAYRNMKSRVTGVQRKKAHIYKGLPLLERDAFYAWAWDSPDFWRLYRRWVASGYTRTLTPSVNRIDADKGYVLGNIEWVTHSTNSALARPALRRALEQLRAEI